MEYHSGGSLPLLGRPRYCPGANANGGYLCETGHCCGETGCCTYYYELWWFWLLWTVLILFSCCCAYRHRRAKLRVQQQQRQREISLLAYHGANSYPSSMLDLSFLASLKLPSYEEVAAQPSTPPPPYSSVFTTPRYPQPPRTADPHLLTQHGPLLHRPLSDGPSSLSSDNSSSCSCDSCCPSSPCSSSLSAPVTYETDTSHASTPSEATPLTLDVTMETITAAATRLEVNEARLASETRAATVAVDIDDADAAGAQEPIATDSSVPNQTVTVAVITRAASPQPPPSPGPELTLPVGTTSPTMEQLDIAPCTPTVSACSLSTLPSPNAVDTTLPSIQIISTEGPATIPAPKTTSMSGPPTPTGSGSLSPKAPEALETLKLSRTLDTSTVPCSPASVPSPDVGRTLALITGSDGLPMLDPSLSLMPIPAPSKLTPDQEPESLPSVHIQASDPAPLNQILVPNPQPKTNADSISNPNLTPKSAHSDLNLDAAAPTSPILARNLQLSCGSGFVHSPPSPETSQHSGSVAVLVSCLDSPVVADRSGLSPVHAQSSDLILPLPSDVEAGISSGSGSGLCSGSGSLSTPTPVLTFSKPGSTSLFCPAINIESELSLANSQSPSAAVSPSSPPSLTSPPSPPSLQSLSSTSLPAPALLLDPLTALHQSDKGGSSSGHASSLSPSPRATQSPPKQTLFSPCVDVFEPGPPCWEDEDEEQEEKENDEDEDEDMGADESQYRHRRLTGDSGIEVCRCRVEDEDEEEEGERKEEGRIGGGGEHDKKGGGNTDLHDSMDCPVRGQMTTGEGLALCTTTATPTSEDSGKVVIVMETV
ncbi:flocculation protein FLO11-like [Stegastes partitus]|uniref:Flocculation protein FLO11-like n=1 Tax=Stegastes partitus TaxID=144197 RepID=A0A3B5B0N3_9TELE|nr:PREDICTED: flocculation protein FLO11-like [Stegastes partitus]XP_008290875.1 PREDICTED: flocculation protein FLO11-like [Stegastes partitus]